MIATADPTWWLILSTFFGALAIGILVAAASSRAAERRRLTAEKKLADEAWDEICAAVGINREDIAADYRRAQQAARMDAILERIRRRQEAAAFWEQVEGFDRSGDAS